jgi:hypothetical protein
VVACVDEIGLGANYVYLLGIYLGDGMLTLAPKRVWRLRISLDAKYPEIIDRCKNAIADVAIRPAGNHSADIRELFMWACRLIGVESRQNNAYNISVARRASVEILDSFIGPKR